MAGDVDMNYIPFYQQRPPTERVKRIVYGSVFCDTGVPRYGMPGDTGWPRGDWHKRGPLIDYNPPPKKIVPIRCPYCNVRALPEDRFCEGCGAPV